jgi:hypothetical protein
MPETGGANIEVAHHLNESHTHESAQSHRRIHQVVEIVEALLLAAVAIATAWSGYQSARWDSMQSVLYGQSSRLRTESQVLQAEADQLKLYNALTVVEWLKAEARGETKLAELFEKRMLGDFHPAFEAWKKTDPLHNDRAPAGPFTMPEYQDSRTAAAARKNHESADLFERGTQARERADEYVRVTVFLATVLLLTAISQRFRSHRIRTFLVGVALLMLTVPVWRLVILPRM